MASDSSMLHAFMWVISHTQYGDSTSAEKGNDLLKVVIHCISFIGLLISQTLKKNAYIVPGAVCKAQEKQINKAQSMPSRSWQVKQIFAVWCGESIEVLQSGAEMLSVGGGGDKEQLRGDLWAEA